MKINQPHFDSRAQMYDFARQIFSVLARGDSGNRQHFSELVKMRIEWESAIKNANLKLDILDEMNILAISGRLSAAIEKGAIRKIADRKNF